MRPPTSGPSTPTLLLNSRLTVGGARLRLATAGLALARPPGPSAGDRPATVATPRGATTARPIGEVADAGRLRAGLLPGDDRLAFGIEALQGLRGSGDTAEAGGLGQANQAGAPDGGLASISVTDQARPPGGDASAGAGVVRRPAGGDIDDLTEGARAARRPVAGPAGPARSSGSEEMSSAQASGAPSHPGSRAWRLAGISTGAATGPTAGVNGAEEMARAPAGSGTGGAYIAGLPVVGKLATTAAASGRVSAGGSPGQVRTKIVLGAVAGAGPPARVVMTTIPPGAGVLGPGTPPPVSRSSAADSPLVRSSASLRIDRSAGTAGLSVATTVGTSTALALVLLLSSVAIRRARNWSRSRPAIELRSRWHPLQHFFTTAAIDTTRLAEAGFPNSYPRKESEQRKVRQYHQKERKRQGAQLITARTIPGGDARRAVLGLLLFATAMAMLLVIGAGAAHADQTASVSNNGTAVANTGDNDATGNKSDNHAESDQDADADGGDDGDAVAANFGGASDHSEGEAHIDTGDAHATGVHAETHIDQDSEGDDSGDQDAEVDNEGHARANTGDNDATGNKSDNHAESDQDADADGGDDGDAVAANFGGASNHSEGEAHIDTGDAHATGVHVMTMIEQALKD